MMGTFRGSLFRILWGLLSDSHIVDWVGAYYANARAQTIGDKGDKPALCQWPALTSQAQYSGSAIGPHQSATPA